MNGKMSMQAEREVPLLMQRKPVATLNEYTGKPVMKSAHWAYESAAAAAHELPPDGGTKAALCAAYSAFTNVKTEFAKCRFSLLFWGWRERPILRYQVLYCMPPAIIQAKTRATAM